MESYISKSCYPSLGVANHIKKDRLFLPLSQRGILSYGLVQLCIYKVPLSSVKSSTNPV